jgi:hypothetical protein
MGGGGHLIESNGRAQSQMRDKLRDILEESKKKGGGG